MGRQASPDKKPIKRFNCTSHVALAQTKEKSESIAPGCQNKLTKTCNEIGRSTTTDVIKRRWNRQEKGTRSPGRRNSKSVIQTNYTAPDRPWIAVSAKECPSLGVVLSIALFCLPEVCSSNTWSSGTESWDADVLEERLRRLAMK